MTHQWQTDTSGRPDNFVMDSGDASGRTHNGPRCTVCGFTFCEHCWPEGWQQTCPGPPPEGMEYDWIGCGTTREPEVPELTPVIDVGGPRS
ncbi:hypothetical protein QQG74_09745 [Micromonospora sp. FIMYZ51]|uniref:hypothetical protein n=1 Tax=Micromonospora sp. FIMYZ51 TaxID=3051832 RepID=UPI00311D742A